MAPRIRKSVSSLSANEKATFIGALLELKRTGIYDHFVHTHMVVMAPATLRWEPRAVDYRNGAHRGPVFLPWHRAFLLHLEKHLQRIDSSIMIPYWDCAADADPATSPVWQADFLGGDGLQTDQWRVQDGAFAERAGMWTVPEYPEAVDAGLPGTGLKRQFGKFDGGGGGAWDSLPTQRDIDVALAERLYDAPPYWASPFNAGFRNRIEGFITRRADPGVTKPGPQLHNRVHMWIGGNMILMTSPDDPAFFLHHAFIDRVWAVWQSQQLAIYPDERPHYAPIEGGPPGHNLNDIMDPFGQTPRDVLDIRRLGYTYEGLEVDAQRAPRLGKSARNLPFFAE